MSTVKANNHQIGQSGTATNNFTLYQPSTPDGTVRLAVGNSGATTGDVLSVSSTGLSVTGTLTSTGVNTFPAGSASAPSITTTGDTNTGVFFPAADTVGVTTGGAEAARINSSGTLILKGGSTSATGVGITFPADTTTTVSSNANTLDDYEEGTWTPTIIATATNPTVSYNTNGQRGYYTKIGRVVYFQAFLAVSSISSGSGDLVCGGLPFTVSGDVGTLRTWGNIVVGTSGVNWGTSKTALAGYARGGETSIYVLAMQNDTSWGGIPIGNVANGDEMVWSGWYQV